MKMINPVQIFLGSCITDETLIDVAVQEGLGSAAFERLEHKEIWKALLKGRTEGRSVDSAALCLSMGKDAPMQEIFDCEAAAPTSANGKKALRRLIEAHVLRQLNPALSDIQADITDGSDYESIRAKVENLQLLVQPVDSQDETLDQIIDSALSFIKKQVNEEVSDSDGILTGIPGFDRLAGAIQEHEYVVIGARTSVGKSSLVNQMAGYNLLRGKKVVIFTLETSARAVVLQIAAQRVGVNLRHLKEELPERLKRFESEINNLRSKNLLVFDKDLTLEKIEARCRLLAANFKPDAVFVDYLGLIRAKGEGSYERMTGLSKAMIPLRKTLNCPLIVAAQLNRGNEKDNRPPSRTDFRDTGSIEEDAHRIIAIHRPKADPATGMDQDINGSTFYSELYQLKLRDGNLAHYPCKYNARWTRFEDK